MKQNPKKAINFLILLIIISFTTICCEKDFEENSNTDKTSQKVISHKILYGENFFRTHPNIRQELNSKLEQNLNAKMVSSTYNFEIDETKVQVLETNEYSVYTFQIENDNVAENILENYILIEYTDNSIKHFIATYPYNVINGEKIFNKNSIVIEINNPNLNDNEVMNRENPHINNPNCYWVNIGSMTYTEYVEGENCPCEGHSFGQTCTCPSGQPTPGGYQEFQHIFWSYECNSGGGVGYHIPGDGIGSGGGGSVSSPNDEIVTSPFDNDQNLQIIDPDCDELIRNSNDSIFRQNMIFLKTDLITSDLEKGFPIYNGNYINPPFAENPVVGPIVPGTAQQGPQIPYHTSIKAIVHNHLKDPMHNHIGTFTPDDIIQLLNLYKNHQQQNSPVTKTEMASYLVCDEGNYVLKISNYSKLYLFANKYIYDANFKNKIDKFYKEKNIIHGKPKNDQNIGFLKLLKEYDIGVKIFESDQNFENWSELELNSNANDINKKPC